MGSTASDQFWTCPHCFAVIDWLRREQIEKHNCKAIQELVGAPRTRVMRLDSMIKTLKNPNPKRKKEKKHGT